MVEGLVLGVQGEVVQKEQVAVGQGGELLQKRSQAGQGPLFHLHHAGPGQVEEALGGGALPRAPGPVEEGVEGGLAGEEAPGVGPAASCWAS